MLAVNRYLSDCSKEIASSLKKHVIVATIAPGRSLAEVEGILGSELEGGSHHAQYPALVGEGMTAFCVNGNVTPEELADVKLLLESRETEAYTGKN